MSRAYRISRQAQSDLDQIWDYITRDSPASARRFVERVIDNFELLAHHPLSGEAREELAANLRSFSVGHYVIYYRPVALGDVPVEIVRVLHGARDIGSLF